MNNRSTTPVVVFTCNWDGLSCVEAAARARLNYPASVRVLKVSCLSRLHHGLILKAFERGAEGVMLLGCEPGNCLFDTDTGHIVAEYEKARIILKMLGLGEERLVHCRIPRGDGPAFVKQVTGFVMEIGQMRSAALVR